MALLLAVVLFGLSFLAGRRERSLPFLNILYW